MQRAVVVTGRLINPTTIELDEPVRELGGEVEVVLRAVGPVAEGPATLCSAFLRDLPPGSRSKEDIDRQIQSERDSWSEG